MALIRRIGFTRFSRWGDNLGRLTVSSATHTDALDGTDELHITCSEDLVKGDRVVWVDLQGVCHEHIVDTIDRVHDDSAAPETQAVCINSINETWDDWLDDKRPSGGVSVALTSVLAGTRWEVGTCDQEGSASRTFYHVSVREGLAGIIETWGGELETNIVHNGAGIVRRLVGVRAKRGNQNSAKRFTWTKDLVSVKRTVASDNPKTRVYGYGKGVETEGGGYGRRLTFGDINDGKDYVEDADATAVWGHPDGAGGILPAVASYVNEQCEDAEQLLQETKDHLEKVKEPKVTYTASVIDLYAFGRSWEGVGVGDAVAIIDKGFSDEGVRLHGRVSQIERDLLTGDATVTFGTLTDSMADMWQSVSNALKGNSQQNALYDAVAGTSVSWLIQLMQALNTQFNAVGTYKVETFELGTIWSNVPLNPETGLPVKATSGMWAININGRGQRLASNLTSEGQWNWTTYVTGEGVNASCINAGTMRADRIRAGLLTDEAGKNYWDMTNSEFRLSASAVVGEGTAGDIVVNTDVEFGLSESMSDLPESWGPDASWERGKYLWQRLSMTTIGGQTEKSEPRVIVTASGMGAEDFADQYYLSTSDTELVGGSWSNSQPPWVAGRYYWTRTQITWSDGTVTTTPPELARALTSGNQSTDDLDSALNQENVFNRLTNGGDDQGIYLSNGKIYLNASFIKTGSLSADLIKTGSINASLIKTGSLNADLITSGHMSADRITSGTMSADRISGGTIDTSSIRVTSGSNVIAIDASNGLKVTNSGKFIAGILGSFFYCTRVGDQNGYIRMGTGSSGYGSMEYVQNNVAAFEVVPTSRSGSRAGLCLRANSKPFAFVHTADGYTDIGYPGSGTITNGMTGPHVRFNSSQAYLYGGGSSQVFLSSGSAAIYKDSTHYVILNDSQAMCRCGSKGYGLMNGNYSSTWTW